MTEYMDQQAFGGVYDCVNAILVFNTYYCKKMIELSFTFI